MTYIQEAVYAGLETYAVTDHKIADQSNLYDDLGMDSLDMLDLAMDLEEQFDIVVLDDEIERAQTAGDVVRLVEGKVA